MRQENINTAVNDRKEQKVETEADNSNIKIEKILKIVDRIKKLQIVSIL